MHVKNTVILLLAAALLWACGNDNEGLQHRDITGKFQLVAATTSYYEVTEHGGESKGDDILKDCDLQTTVEFEPNGGVRQILYSGENCNNKRIRLGNWKVTSTFFGSFHGEINFQDSDIVCEVFESDASGETITQFRIEYEDENMPENIRNYRYHYTYKRVE